jgi:hypothetical protein
MMTVFESSSEPGLPDGFFSDQIWVNLGLLMEKGWYILGHFEYNTAFSTFGNLVAIWYILPSFGILRREKSGNPGLNHKINFPHFVISKSSCLSLETVENVYFKNSDFFHACLCLTCWLPPAKLRRLSIFRGN